MDLFLQNPNKNIPLSSLLNKDLFGKISFEKAIFANLLLTISIHKTPQKWKIPSWFWIVSTLLGFFMNKKMIWFFFLMKLERADTTVDLSWKAKKGIKWFDFLLLCFIPVCGSEAAFLHLLDHSSRCGSLKQSKFHTPISLGIY